MQTLKLGNATFTLSPIRNVGELQAKLAKCDGKYKPTKIKGDKRAYPTFAAGMSTADYVEMFERMNNGNGMRSTRYLKHEGFFAPLNTNPCTLYSGEDSHEIINEEPAANEPVQLDSDEFLRACGVAA